MEYSITDAVGLDLGCLPRPSAGPKADVGAAPSLVLTTTHISPLGKKVGGLRVELPVGGGLVKLCGGGPGRFGGGKRGKVGRFSRASRRRMLQLLASVNKESLVKLPLFLGLTYPGEYIQDPGRWKRDLDVFLKRVRRRWPESAVVWKLEPQLRGAPHYHLIVFGVSFIDKGWLSQAWYEIVASDDPNHLIYGTRVERVDTWRGVMAYAAKYLGKVPDEALFPEYVGRWWGVSGRDYLPIQLYTQFLDRGVFYAFRRVLYHYLKKQGVEMRKRAGAGVSVFLDASVGFDLLYFYGGV